MSDEMVEKAARHLWEYGCSAGMSPPANDALMIGHFKAEISRCARSAVRDAVRECAQEVEEQFPGPGGKFFASALRKKFEVEGSSVES